MYSPLLYPYATSYARSYFFVILVVEHMHCQLYGVLVDWEFLYYSIEHRLGVYGFHTIAWYTYITMNMIKIIFSFAINIIIIFN